MKNLNRWQFTWLGIYSICILYLGYFSIQNQFVSILIPAFVGFISFLKIYQLIRVTEMTKAILLPVFLLKFILVFAFPHLSDDIYRFWWDGYLSTNGYDPHAFSPRQFMQLLEESKIKQALLDKFDRLNSQAYPTAYPLVCQWIFRFAATISQENIYLFSLVLKLLFLAADISLLYILQKILINKGVSPKNSFLFYANPLCIVELNGNLHFEMYLILFFLLAIFYFELNKHFLAGLAFGLSVVSKLVSLLWLPLFLLLLRNMQRISSFIIGFSIPLIFFICSIFSTLSNYESGLSLYFRKFEFNSLIYKQLYNLLGKLKWYEVQAGLSFYLMMCFCLLCSLFIIRAKREGSFSFSTAWSILFSYLIFSSTVHPWYLTPLVAVSLFSNWRTGIAWSFLIFLSYARYDVTCESYYSLLILVEYISVFLVLIYETFYSKRNFAIV